MFSLLAMVTTALVLGSALLWRALMKLSRARPAALLRGLWRGGAIFERLLSRRAAPTAARRGRAGPH